jgi:rubrerythrin
VGGWLIRYGFSAGDVFRIAVPIEREDSIIFFLSIEEALSGQKDREFIKNLVKEEQERLRRLTL